MIEPTQHPRWLRALEALLKLAESEGAPAEVRLNAARQVIWTIDRMDPK